MNFNFLSSNLLNYLCPYTNFIKQTSSTNYNNFSISIAPEDNFVVTIDLSFLEQGISYKIRYKDTNSGYSYISGINLVKYKSCFTHEIHPTFLGFEVIQDIGERDNFSCKLYLDFQNPKYIQNLLDI